LRNSARNFSTNGFGAGYLCAAQFEALKLVQEIAAHGWRQSLQIFQDSIGLYHRSHDFSLFNEALMMS